jgi:hypothetical protein
MHFYKLTKKMFMLLAILQAILIGTQESLQEFNISNKLFTKAQ